ncbi:hypothetical protein CEV33_3539 [Brucella grignonensis]|uniref:Uncharacterized protein n=1 Tax=Brucella grignonensis TaxID=94627 RepID=A0A256EZ58_9HYPH|nr:hypothetical protein CEV33_3539 [Brucella grignonensis]
MFSDCAFLVYSIVLKYCASCLPVNVNSISEREAMAEAIGG